jgi:hypothetical protein
MLKGESVFGQFDNTPNASYTIRSIESHYWVHITFFASMEKQALNISACDRDELLLNAQLLIACWYTISMVSSMISGVRAGLTLWWRKESHH